MKLTTILCIVGLCSSSLLWSGAAKAQTCEYFLGYIHDEAERPYAVNKVYRYTPEKLQEILTIRDQGKALCEAGSEQDGVTVLLKAVKLINFTRLK